MKNIKVKILIIMKLKKYEVINEVISLKEENDKKCECYYSNRLFYK